MPRCPDAQMPLTQSGDSINYCSLFYYGYNYMLHIHLDRINQPSFFTEAVQQFNSSFRNNIPHSTRICVPSFQLSWALLMPHLAIKMNLRVFGALKKNPRGILCFSPLRARQVVDAQTDHAWHGSLIPGRVPPSQPISSIGRTPR